MMITVAVLSPLPAIAVEIILLLRLLAVYPYHRTPRTTFYAIFIPLSLLKLFRLVNLVYFTVLYARLTPKAGGSPLAAGSLPNELEYPGSRIEWILQAIDNSVCSILFLCRVATTFQAFQRRRNSSSYYSRIRGLLWIASVNYVIPVPLAIAAVIVVFTQGTGVDITLKFSLAMTNSFVSVIGATLASIWAANGSYHANVLSSRITGSFSTASGSLHFDVDSNRRHEHSAHHPGFRPSKSGSTWDQGSPEGELEARDDGIHLPVAVGRLLPEGNVHRLEYVHGAQQTNLVSSAMKEQC